MTREEKEQIVNDLASKLGGANVFYLADTSELDATATSDLRRECFKAQIDLTVVKNTLLKRALEQIEGEDYSELYDSLKGSTSLMVSEAGNGPAKLIKAFRKKHDKPILKAAYIEETIYIGDDQLNTLSEIKSKDELLGEIIGLLQSPAKNVISALKGGGGDKIAGLVKALSER